MHNHHAEHTHPHPSSGSSQRIAWAFCLNLGFTLVEFVGGYLTNSTAIMADAVHDLGDSLAIGLAWVLAKFSQKPASSTFSYGFKRFSLLGSLLNGVILIAGSIWVLGEAIPRLAHPEMPQAQGMLALAIFGVAVNGFAAYKLSGGATLNERMLNWHLLEDVFGWLSVLFVALVLMFVDLPILDPLLSIAFTLFILYNVSKVFWRTWQIFLQAVPDNELENAIRAKLQASQVFAQFHHLHLWSLDGEHHVLTAHIVLQKDIDLRDAVALKQQLAELLEEFSLSHTTVEFEFVAEPCRDTGHFH